MPGRSSVDGLPEVLRGLKRFEPEAAKELRKELKTAGGKVVGDARGHAPRETGEYASKFRVSVTAKGVSIVNPLPQANVLHYGGTIRPRGVPITFKPRPVVSDALERRTGEILDDIGDAVDRAIRTVGLR